MGEIHKIYTEEIHKQLRYRPTWLPGAQMKLGAVGPIEDGIFREVTNLSRLQIPFKESVDPKEKRIFGFTSKGVTLAFKAAGKADGRFTAVTKAQAGALVEFSREGAVVLDLRNVRFNRISDQAGLGRALMRAIGARNESKQWQRDWVVITEVARARTATIIISSTKNAKLELKAKGNVAPANLVDASAKLSLAAASEVNTKIIAESGLTPLYRGLRVRRNFWWLYDEVLPASADVPAAEKVFGDADPVEDSLRGDG